MAPKLSERSAYEIVLKPPGLRTEPEASKKAAGRKLSFLANVDPIDVVDALKGLNPEETLVVVVSKTFTTAETMLNARTVRQWLKSRLGELYSRCFGRGRQIPKHCHLKSSSPPLPYLCHSRRRLRLKAHGGR